MPIANAPHLQTVSECEYYARITADHAVEAGVRAVDAAGGGNATAWAEELQDTLERADQSNCMSQEAIFVLLGGAGADNLPNAASLTAHDIRLAATALAHASTALLQLANAREAEPIENVTESQ